MPWSSRCIWYRRHDASPPCPPASSRALSATRLPGTRSRRCKRPWRAFDPRPRRQEWRPAAPEAGARLKLVQVSCDPAVARFGGSGVGWGRLARFVERESRLPALARNVRFSMVEDGGRWWQGRGTGGFTRESGGCVTGACRSLPTLGEYRGGSGTGAFRVARRVCFCSPSKET